MRGDSSCTRCRLHQLVENVCILEDRLGKANVMIIGDSPSKRDDAEGYLHSSKFLTELLVEHGFEPDEISFANAVACHSVKPPSKAQIKSCGYWLDYQMRSVQPKFVLLMGNSALQAITGKPGIKAQRGHPFEQDGIIYVPTFNLGAAFHDPENRHVISSDINLFRDIIDNGEIPRETELNYKIIKTWDDVEELKEALFGSVSIDIETTCLYPWQKYSIGSGKNKKPCTKDTPKAKYDPAKIVSIGFGTSSGEFTLPINHPESPWTEEEIDEILHELDELIMACMICAHNGKFDFLWLLVHYGLEWYLAMDFDSMLAHYILDENSWHDLKSLSRKFLGAPDYNVDLQTKQGVAPLDKHCLYLAHDAHYTRKLRYKFGTLLNKDQGIKNVFTHILMPCARLFTEIEFDGVFIDMTDFDAAEKQLRNDYNSALDRLSKWEPKTNKLNRKGQPIEFNWGSPQQLSKLLYEDIKIKVIERTPTGNPSTSESVLLRIDHPLIGDLLTFRAAKQQLSFFIDGWKPYLHSKYTSGAWYDFLHPSFKLHGTVTGRPSAEHPNLQQTPRDAIIRSLITAEPGWTLVEWDLSQIELRIATELSGERRMMHAFLNGIDLHWMTALREIERGGGQVELILDTARTAKQDKSIDYSEAIEILIEMGADEAIEIREEWKELRKKAKAINFGFIFGMWWKKLKLYARDNYGVILTDTEAQESRKFFFSEYADLPDWHNSQRRFARKHGYVRSLSGRKRRLPKALLRQDTPERREAERQAINSPVQGFASDLNLMAALQLRKEYGRDKVKICGTVHDAILARVRNDMVPEVARRMLEIMKKPDLFKVLGIELSVPIEAECKVGPWSKGISLDKWEKQNADLCRKQNVSRSYVA